MLMRISRTLSQEVGVLCGFGKPMTSIRRSAAAVAALLTLAPGASALAHTPYLLPNTFNPERPRVTIQGALTEDDYFNPDIGLNIPSYEVTLPSGEKITVKPAA